MAFANQLVVGNIGNVYEKRTVGRDNKSVIEFSVGVTPRRRNAQTEEWEDGETYWVNCVAWNRTADNIEKSFRKGDQVMLWGRIDMKDGYTDREGNERPARPQLVVEAASISVDRWPAHSDREVRSDSGARPAPAAKKPAPAASKPAPAASKPAPAEELSFDDLEDDEEMPF